MAIARRYAVAIACRIQDTIVYHRETLYPLKTSQWRMPVNMLLPSSLKYLRLPSTTERGHTHTSYLNGYCLSICCCHRLSPAGDYCLPPREAALAGRISLAANVHHAAAIPFRLRETIVYLRERLPLREASQWLLVFVMLVPSSLDLSQLWYTAGRCYACKRYLNGYHCSLCCCHRLSP